jgi:5-methylcytosine-specific restriction protein A
MFTIGQSYRRLDLHDRFGGQRQGGISTPANHPIILLFTGEQGERYGYEDGFRDDGTFWYTGEGQVGDMEMARGNLGIRDHRKNGESLHLFTYKGQPRGHVGYMGEATYLGHRTETAPDRNGDPRRAIVFELDLSTDSGGSAARSVVEEDPIGIASEWRESIDKLRERAMESASEDDDATVRRNKAYKRGRAVRVYVLRRADGTCEGCAEPAPFQTPQERPYLEPHHIRRRADGGPDHPRWVIALCPNCHRRVHHGEDGREYNERLADRVAQIEG